MIKGKTIAPLPKWADVLKFTNGGWDVFISEIPSLSLGRSFCSPLRRDKNPSCSVVCKGGVWYMKDWSSGETLSALQLVQKKYGLSFVEAVTKMAKDSGLMEVFGEDYIIQPLTEAPEYQENETQISFTDGKWKKEHYKYWDGTEVDEPHCRKYNTFAVKDLAINRRRIKLREREVVFAYYAEDIDKVKIYFPERQKEDKWRNNVPGNYIWGLTRTKECEKLLVHKSMKDLLVSAIIFPCNIATQNESSSIFTPELVDYLHTLSSKIYIAYGADDQGTRESIEITKKNKWLWVNTPKKFLPEINDFYSLTKGHGIEELIRLYKYKRIL